MIPHKHSSSRSLSSSASSSSSSSDRSSFPSLPSKPTTRRDVDRVVATAQHILRTLSSDQADDMVQILSDFDNRLAVGLRSQKKRSQSVDFSSPRSQVHVPTHPSDKLLGYGDLALCADDAFRSFPPPLRSAATVILRWDLESRDTSCSDVKTFLWSDASQDEIPSFLHAVDTLNTFIRSLSNSTSTSTSSSSSSPFAPPPPPPTNEDASRILDHAQNVLQSAMFRLEMEFAHILQQYSEPADPEAMSDFVSGRRSSFHVAFSFSSSNSNSSRRGNTDDEHLIRHEEDPEELADDEDCIARSGPVSDTALVFLPPDAVSDLQRIARRMLLSGYDTECTDVYVNSRKSTLEESLQRIPGCHRFTFEDVHKMPWETLESEIRDWIQATKIIVTGILPGEKQLCEWIFADSPHIAASCFISISKINFLQHLSFADAVAVVRRAPEKLWKILDMYECLQKLVPSIEALFGQEGPAVTSEVYTAMSRLGDAARGTFAEFEHALQRDEEISRNSVLSNSALLPVAKYVMKYLVVLTDYEETVNQLLCRRKDVTTGSPDQSASEKSPLSVAILRLLEILEKNLEAKAKLCQDLPLSCLFMMNNLHHIALEVKGSALRKHVGDEWIKRNSGKLRQYHTTYRTTWRKVLTCLKDEGISIIHGVANNIAKNAIKEKFRAFNIAFEENVKTQSCWVVSDPQLQAELIVSVTEMILPAYRSFFGRFHNHLDGVKNRERYVKYTPEDLETHLNGLFEGNSAPSNKRRP